MGDTINNEKATVIDTSTQSWNSQASPPDSNGKEVMKSVLAGVFRPLKESVWVSSTLNIAKRSAAKTAIKKAM